MLHTGLPPLSIRIRLKQIKLAGPALCQEPVLYVCVGGWGGGGELLYIISTRDVWILITVSE